MGKKTLQKIIKIKMKKYKNTGFKIFKIVIHL